MSSWSDLEEKYFEKIMVAGSMERLPAIRLYRRAKGDITRALELVEGIKRAAEAHRKADPVTRLMFPLDRTEAAMWEAEENTQAILGR